MLSIEKSDFEKNSLKVSILIIQQKSVEFVAYHNKSILKS